MVLSSCYSIWAMTPGLNSRRLWFVLWVYLHILIRYAFVFKADPYSQHCNIFQSTIIELQRTFRTKVVAGSAHRKFSHSFIASGLSLAKCAKPLRQLFHFVLLTHRASGSEFIHNDSTKSCYFWEELLV